MASKKKESEGIALLSMYGDEDDDMEEDATNDDDNSNDDNSAPTENKERREVGANETVNMEEDDSDALHNSNIMGYAYGSSIAPVNLDRANDNTTPNSIDNSTPPPLPAQQAISSEPRRGREGTLTIVDYGHDEAALSPEAEVGEIAARGRVMFGAELQTANGTPPGSVQLLTPNRQPTPQLSEHVESDAMDNSNNNKTECAAVEEEAVNNNMSEDGQKEIDYLDKFLPPPPSTKCSDELQEKIIKFILLKKKTGRSFNSEVRNRKEYRNPDFLTHAVTYQDIDQIGSNFSKDVHDPHGFDPSDFYDEIEADLKREAERKEQEKKKNQKIDFLSGGTQPAALPIIPTPKILPVPAVPNAVSDSVVGSGTGTREGRPNKKSKWDKVDGGDRRHPPVTTTGQDSAAAANAATGYTAFAQQRRREAEERRSSDRKLDRRS